MSELDWPPEQALSAASTPRWSQPRSNILLDFHGDPRRAPLVVFSDGNHHMALEACLQGFLARHPQVEDVFYTTTPPSVLLQWIESGSVHLGNLRLTLRPHLFISPPNILDQVVAAGHAANHVPFMRSRGNVLLVRKHNPKGIYSISDLARADVRLFLSNPKTETASYEVYARSLEGLARRQGLAAGVLADAQIVYGERIHHREAPQALADDRADAAFLYYHLALRYTRIFPDRFELVTLDATPEDPASVNVVSRFHLALIDDGGTWGGQLREFLLGAEAAAIYVHHGLQPD